MRKATPKEHARHMAEALTNLTVLNSIVSICEGGNFYGSGNDEAEKIIKICQTGMQKSLRRYDAARAKIPKTEVQR